jgi:hypothetical protein
MELRSQQKAKRKMVLMVRTLMRFKFHPLMIFLLNLILMMISSQ